MVQHGFASLMCIQWVVTNDRHTALNSSRHLRELEKTPPTCLTVTSVLIDVYSYRFTGTSMLSLCSFLSFYKQAKLVN